MSGQTSAVGMERKLAAIFSTDVAGYSRLMGDDEEATIRTLTACRAVISSLIQHYRGRVVDSPGDNLLAEFSSVVDAVRCAVEIQRALTEKNAELPDHCQMRFRIGINLGDVIVEGERLYGDGVNIAARLEGVAEPGGLCIAGTVYDQVKNKLEFGYEDLGPQTVKNIADPVRAYRVRWEDSASQKTDDLANQKVKVKGHTLKVEERAGFARRKGAMAAAVSLLLIAATIGVVRYWPSPIPNTHPLTPSTHPLPLPDKPSIAVLPFTNMSADPEQEYFSDGITDDIITDLSKISGLFVVARNSTFTYKGQAVKVQDVGREMGVRYVLEGSVRKAENHVRITVQLIDATTGYHVWSERYDRELKDIFAVQDETVQHIVAALRTEVVEAEMARVKRIPTADLTAYDFVLRGLASFEHLTKEGNSGARQMFEKAVERDPQYAAAYAYLSATYWREWLYQWSRDLQNVEQALTLAQKGVALDDSLPAAHSVLGQVYMLKTQFERAVAEGERAVALDPNNPQGYLWLANILGPAGRTEEAIESVRKAMRLNPRHPPMYLLSLGVAYHQAWRNEEAIATYKQYLALQPNTVVPYFGLTCSYSDLGRYEEARAAAAEILRFSPNFTTDAWRKTQWFKDPAELERHLNNLRKAGLK